MTDKNISIWKVEEFLIGKLLEKKHDYIEHHFEKLDKKLKKNKE